MFLASVLSVYPCGFTETHDHWLINAWALIDSPPFIRLALSSLLPCLHHSPWTKWGCVCLCAKGHCVGGFHYQDPLQKEERTPGMRERLRHILPVLGCCQDESWNSMIQSSWIGWLFNELLVCVLNLTWENNFSLASHTASTAVTAACLISSTKQTNCAQAKHAGYFLPWDVQVVVSHRATVCCSFSVWMPRYWRPAWTMLWHTVSLPFHVQTSFSCFLIHSSRALFSALLLSAASKHLLLWVHVSGSRLHMRHSSFSFSNLSLHFHILSHLEPGCTHRCGEHFCWLAHWSTSTPLSTPFLPPTHICTAVASWKLHLNFKFSSVQMYNLGKLW